MIYDGAEMLVEAFQSFPTGKTKVKCTGMSEKFNPLQESCQTACVRACAEELKASVSEEGARISVRVLPAQCSRDDCCVLHRFLRSSSVGWPTVVAGLG